jgi:hypothetical protein
MRDIAIRPNKRLCPTRRDNMDDSDAGSGRLAAACSRHRRLSVRCFESGHTSDRVAYPRDTGTAAIDIHGAAQALASLEFLLESGECGAPAGQKDDHRRTERQLCKQLWAKHSHQAEPTPPAVVGGLRVSEEEENAQFISAWVCFGSPTCPTHRRCRRLAHRHHVKPVLSSRYACIPLAQFFSTPDHNGRCRNER